MSQVREYSRIQSEYASYSGGQGIQETIDALKPLRPPTAPSRDLDAERRAITREVQQNMFLVQFALFILVASLVAYLILPTDTAHGIVFLLLCVGIATGFFLKK